MAKGHKIARTRRCRQGYFQAQLKRVQARIILLPIVQSHWAASERAAGSIRHKAAGKAQRVFLLLQRDQLAHFAVAQAASGKQAVGAVEVVSLQINQHVGVRHKHLVRKNRALAVARGWVELVVVGGDAFGSGHKGVMVSIVRLQHDAVSSGPIFTHESPLMTERHSTPGKDEIALLAPFERLGLNQIEVIANAQQAASALQALASATILGFDTESKPTFAKNEASSGPHIVQLSTLDKAYIFQLEDASCRHAVGQLLEAPGLIKAGFGLGDDRRRIIDKLGVDLQGVLDLNHVFRERGYRKDMGVRGAVAVLFKQRFIKSRKATTSNWANVRLSEAQIIYAANDAYAALRVHQALGL